MKSKRAIILAGVLFAAVICYGFLIGGDKIPEGWFKAGSSPNSYDIGIEKKGGNNGENAVYIKSIEKNI